MRNQFLKGGSAGAATAWALSNRFYDRLKWFALIFLPALSVLLRGLADIYGWQWVPTVISTLDVIAVFVGALLQISTHHYHKDGLERGTPASFHASLSQEEKKGLAKNEKILRNNLGASFAGPASNHCDKGGLANYEKYFIDKCTKLFRHAPI